MLYPMKTTLFCVLGSFFFPHFISAANKCIAEKSTSCQCILENGSSFDLSSLGSNNNHPLFYEVIGPKLNDTYTSLNRYAYNPCYAFTYPDTNTQGSCVGVAACRKNPGGDLAGELPQLYPLGLQENALFYFDIDDDGNVTTYINYTYPEPPTRRLTVYLKCIEDDSAKLTVDDDDGDNVIMTLESKCACLDKCSSPKPDQKKNNLSTGSILLITFFTILIIYFVFGIGWNFCNGAKGSEILPNIEFWNDLPKLIMEGIAFTCSCCSRRNTYGDI